MRQLGSGRATLKRSRRALGERSDGVVRSAEAAERSKLYRSARWKRLRVRFLSEHPACIQCGQRATTVDHKFGHSDPRWRERFFDPAGLAPMCTACHASKSAIERHHR